LPLPEADLAATLTPQPATLGQHVVLSLPLHYLIIGDRAKEFAAVG
jgi:hypothetical protein